MPRIQSKFNKDDINAVRMLLPPFEKETWDEYIDRAMNVGLMTLGEAIYIAETYGRFALAKQVQRLTE